MTPRQKLIAAYRELLKATPRNRDERAEKYDKALIEYLEVKNDS
ncbi:MAG: hypothetical protein ACPG7F_00155 [Aggregatilineales bacterium]